MSRWLMTSETVEIDTHAFAAISFMVTIPPPLYAGLTVQVSNNRGISEIAGEIMGKIGKIGEIGERGGLDRRGNSNISPRCDWLVAE